MAIQQGKNFLASIFGRFGAGRREADVIVPVQEAIYRQLVAINNEVDDVQDPNMLYTWIEYLNQWRSEFVAFVSDAAFVDGRASQQALNDLIPVIDGTIATVQGQLARIGYDAPTGGGGITWGGGGTQNAGFGGLDATTLALIGVGAAFLLRK